MFYLIKICMHKTIYIPINVQLNGNYKKRTTLWLQVWLNNKEFMRFYCKREHWRRRYQHQSAGTISYTLYTYHTKLNYQKVFNYLISRATNFLKKLFINSLYSTMYCTIWQNHATNESFKYNIKTKLCKDIHKRETYICK